MEHYVQEPAIDNNLNQDGISLHKLKSDSSKINESEDNPSGGLDCNICLEFVQDPVVTFCGHLYCWPCIYKWIHFQSASPEISEQQQPQCPVCKAEVSKDTLIPLYGRGLTSPKSSDGKAPQLGMVIPQRPPSPRCGGHLQTLASPTASSRAVPQLNPRGPPQQHQPFQYPMIGSYMASPTMSLAGTTTTNLIHPVMGMLGDMALARIFGNSETALYSYPNSYHLAGISSSPRLRRHVMETDKSLSRVCFFLCCCMILCLLLF